MGFRRYKLQMLAPSMEAWPRQGLLCAVMKAGAVEKRVLPLAAARGSGAAPENPNAPAGLLGTVLPWKRGDALPEEHFGYFCSTYVALWLCSWLISQDFQGGGRATGACPLPGSDTALRSLLPLQLGLQLRERPHHHHGRFGPLYLQNPGHPCAKCSERRALGRGGRAVSVPLSLPPGLRIPA